MATQRGGIQKSTNGGASFSPTQLASNPASVWIDPNNSAVVYAGTYSGLKKSSDGGGTFNATSFTSPPTALAVDPNNSANVYVGTFAFHGGLNNVQGPTVGQVFQSTDGAGTFSLVPGLSVGEVTALAVDPNDDTVYAGTSSGLFHASHFARTGDMNDARAYLPTVLLPSGKVLLAAGTNGTELTSAELYDPATGTFTSTGSLNTGRHSYTATLLPNGKVLVTGGFQNGGGWTPTAELYDPATEMFTSIGNMANGGRANHTATLLQNGAVLLAGASQQAELYNPSTGMFSLTGVMNIGARQTHTATLLNNGLVLIAGGVIQGFGTSKSAELYDPSTGMFTLTGSMSSPRVGHVATLLPDGRVLVAGGTATDTNFANDVLQAEVYDPTTGQFAPTPGSLSEGRAFCGVASLADGEVLIAGGINPAGSFVGSAELFDPATGKFSRVGSMAFPRVSFPIATLQNGNALLAGGVGDANHAELFDPSTFGFQKTGVYFSPVNAIAVDPTTVPSTVYAAVFQGVVRSNNGFPPLGSPIVDFVGGGGFNSLALDTSVTPAKLYAGDGNGEILTSTDQGNTVTVQNILGFNPGPVLAIAAPSNAPGTVYAAPFEEFDATVTQLSSDLSSVSFSSFLGGTQGDFGNGIAVGPTGNAYMVGGTASPDFRGAANQLEGRDNVFVAKIGNTGTGSNVSVEPCSNCIVTYPTVTLAGNTTATTTVVAPGLPAGYQSTGSFTLISTTAAVTATTANPIQVCFDYSNFNVTNAANLSLVHYQDGAWVNVTVSNDTTNKIICGAVTTLSPFAVVEGKPIAVQIMIKPPSTPPVTINLSSAGNIPVAILSTKTFDATTVNPATINLEGAAVKLKGNGGYSCSASDVNGDGIKDFVCQVPTNQFQLITGSDVAVLTAETNGNLPVQGQETIKVVPN